MSYRILITVAVLVMCGALVAADAPAADAPVKRAAAPTAEGLELFSWFVKGDDTPRFALLPAPTGERLKTAEDVATNENTLTGLEALKKKLSALAIGEKVGWYNMLAKGKPIPEGLNFEFPSRETVRELELHCAILKVRLNIYRSGKK